MSDLDNILNEEEPGEISQNEAIEPVARDDSGRFTPKGNEEGAMPAPEDDKAEKTVPVQSYLAEKQKRQEWEGRYEQDIASLRRELEALKAPKQEPQAPPSIWEDEQGTFQHYGAQFTQTAVEIAARQSLLQTSELLMMQQQQDFVEAKQDIFRFVGENPAVNAEVQRSQHPWQTAYKAYKNYQAMQQLGTTDLAEIESKLREKIMAEQQAAQPNLPRSLADAQSSRQSAKPQANNLSLDDILSG
jgi:chromosome segregation ATPase